MSALRGRVIRAEELGLRLEADAILAAARADAAAIREEARRAGFAEGREAGAAEATRLLAEAAVGIRREAGTLEPAIAATIAEGIAAVIATIPAPERVALAASTAISALAERGRVIVTLHPDAAEEARRTLSGAAETLRILTDPALPPDGCIIETAAGRTDAGIDTQLAALRRALGLEAG